MLDRLEEKYAKTAGISVSAVPSIVDGKAPATSLHDSPLKAIIGAFQPKKSSDPEVYNDAYADDADWFQKAANAENAGMTPTLDYPQHSVKAPSSFDSQKMSDSIASIDADIRAREDSWDRLVNDGGREWAKNDDYVIRNAAAARIRAAENSAQEARHLAYAAQAASKARGAMMEDSVRKTVYDAKWREQQAEQHAAVAERQAAMLRVVAAAATAKTSNMEKRYSALKKSTAARLHRLHQDLRHARAMEDVAKADAASEAERASLARRDAEDSSAKASQMQSQVDSLLTRLGDSRAGLAWLSANLQAAKDDSSAEEKTANWWQNKAKKAGSRARDAEKSMQGAMASAAREKRKAQRMSALEKQAEAKEHDERQDELAALTARREAEVWATKEEGEAASEKLQAESEALKAEKHRKRLAKAVASMQAEREREVQDEKAEAEAEGKAKLAEEDESVLRKQAGILQVVAGQREAFANSSLAQEKVAEEHAAEAARKASVAAGKQRDAEEAEKLALQRMHALEASGMQDSHELLRLRQKLAKVLTHYLMLPCDAWFACLDLKEER